MTKQPEVSMDYIVNADLFEEISKAQRVQVGDTVEAFSMALRALEGKTLTAEVIDNLFETAGHYSAQVRDAREKFNTKPQPDYSKGYAVIDDPKENVVG